MRCPTLCCSDAPTSWLLSSAILLRTSPSTVKCWLR
ncbi:Uncharacterised protein [Vibrio cholerae]|nr:Uncharacterised protein [Vibrio cholerae]